LSRAGKVLASDGTVQKIQSLHDTQAADGDTITLPAGTFSGMAYVCVKCWELIAVNLSRVGEHAKHFAKIH
jgi:hypothetical protein